MVGIKSRRLFDFSKNNIPTKDRSHMIILYNSLHEDLLTDMLNSLTNSAWSPAELVKSQYHLESRNGIEQVITDMVRLTILTRYGLEYLILALLFCILIIIYL